MIDKLVGFATLSTTPRERTSNQPDISFPGYRRGNLDILLNFSVDCNLDLRQTYPIHVLSWPTRYNTPT